MGLPGVLVPNAGELDALPVAFLTLGSQVRCAYKLFLRAGSSQQTRGQAIQDAHNRRGGGPPCALGRSCGALKESLN